MTTLDASLRLRLVDEVSATARAAGAALDQMGTQAASGARQGATAFEEMKLAELAASREAARLRLELRRLETSGEGAEGEMRELSLAMVRARQESARLGAEARQLSTAQASVGTASATSATATTGGLLRVSDASKLAGRGMAENINLVSELALGFGSLSPRTQQLGLSFATAGNNAFALAGALGAPGVIAGTLVGVLPGLISFFRSASDETDAMAASADNARQSFLELADAIGRARTDEQREQAILEGRGEVDETQNALELARRQAREVAAAQRQEVTRITRRADGSGQAVDDAVGVEAAARQLAERGISANFEQNSENIRQIVASLRAAGVQIDDRRQGGTEAIVFEVAAAIRDSDTEEGREARSRVPQLERALVTAQGREAEERAREASAEAPQRASQRAADLLTAAGLTPTQEGQVRASLTRGRLSGRQRTLLGEDRARELLAAQRAIGEAERSAAQARLDGETFADRPDIEPEDAAPITRARRRARQRVAVENEQRESGAADREAFATAVAGLGDLLQGSRTQIVVRVDDNRRASAEVVPLAGAPVDVDASGADLIGGQQ